MHIVLPDEATIAHVRSYLGKPDSYYMNKDGTHYEYQLNTSAPTPHGTVSGRIELYFNPDTKLKRYSIKFYKHFEEIKKTKNEPSGYSTWHSCYTRELDKKELDALGLKMIDRYDHKKTRAEQEKPPDKK